MTSNQYTSAHATEVPGLDLVLTPDGYLTAQRRMPDRGHGFVVRDALTASRLLHPWVPEVAEACLSRAAESQGTEVDPVWDERPGRIPHELVEPGELRTATYLELPVRHDQRIVYYGSADATGEWLATLAVAAIGKPQLAHDLENNWRAAGDYLLHQLAIGGGLVRWGPRAWPGTGLEAQGWRDDRNLFRTKGGTILHPDRTPPKPPIADWETQASTLVGLRGLFRLSGSEDHRQAALALEARINQGFDPDAIALDRSDLPVRGASSAAGVLLWAGALSGQQAEAAARRILEPDIVSPFGIRSLAETEPLYDPAATQAGRINAYNSYLAVCGLRAAGPSREAEDIAAGMAEAIDTLGDYPESWAFIDGQLQGGGVIESAGAIAVRHAIRHSHFDSAAGLCEPLLRRL